MFFLRNVKAISGLLLMVSFMLSFNIYIALSDYEIGKTSITQFYISVKDTYQPKSKSKSTKPENSRYNEPLKGINIQRMSRQSVYSYSLAERDSQSDSDNPYSNIDNFLISPKHRILTPNGDGINDKLLISFWVKSTDKDKLKPVLRLYDLDGRQILELAYSLLDTKYLKFDNDRYSILLEFDGMGHNLNMGVYIYTIEVEEVKTNNLTGTIAVITDRR